MGISIEAATTIVGIKYSYTIPTVLALRNWILDQYKNEGWIGEDEIVFIPTLYLALHTFIELTRSKYPAHTRAFLFREAHKLITATCTAQVQQELLQWIQDYNSSHIPHSCYSTHAQESSNYIA